MVNWLKMYPAMDTIKKTGRDFLVTLLQIEQGFDYLSM